MEPIHPYGICKLHALKSGIIRHTYDNFFIIDPPQLENCALVLSSSTDNIMQDMPISGQEGNGKYFTNGKIIINTHKH